MLLNFRPATLVISLVMMSSFSLAATSNQLRARSQKAARVLQEVVSIPDRSIPISLLESATCIATFPEVLRIGFVFGARYGKGLVSCRTDSGWSRPSYLQIRGGSWGYQFGIEKVDLVLVFLAQNSAYRIAQEKLTVGVDATFAVGPIGREARAGTDFSQNSEVYGYSRSRGLFAGLAIGGSVIKVDDTDNASVYGEVSAMEILTNDNFISPLEVLPYKAALMRIAP